MRRRSTSSSTTIAPANVSGASWGHGEGAVRARLGRRCRLFRGTAGRAAGARAGTAFPSQAAVCGKADPARRLVFAGDPQRGIPPCSACHGPGGFKIGAPALQGQHAAYIERQLAAFAQGMRQNDIFEQMRAIAKQLTADEMQELGVFYGTGAGAQEQGGVTSR